MENNIYNTKIFTNVWDDVDDFITDYNNGPFSGCITEPMARKLFFLLYAKYGNSPIANMDEEQFKIKLFSIMFQFGPSWEKRLDIQAKLRNLSEEELMSGSKAIHNHSFNPSTAPYTGSIEELPTVDDQNTSTMKRGKLDAYSTLWSLLVSDVTGEFVKKFQVCFKQFVSPEKILLYESED